LKWLHEHPFSAISQVLSFEEFRRSSQANVLASTLGGYVVGNWEALRTGAKKPYLKLKERSYSFEVEENTGTGVAYTGLLLFDLTLFLLTRLPILVHDTVIFKNTKNLLYIKD
jgi:Uncharacterised protein conserved in bacteria (DUF2326)